MRAKRIDILKRQQRGRRVFPRWKADLEEALQQSVDHEWFLGIEETETLRASFFNAVERYNSGRRFAARDALGQVLGDLGKSLARDGARVVVLFHSCDALIGAVQLQAAQIAGALDAEWSVVEEDLCVATRDLTSGFCLEVNYYDGYGAYFREGVLELTAWGDFVNV